ncbi:biotin-dependent carboxyltransferase family protein [Rubritalea tangerina]|uniref:Biotin-dependent carboxyltransferase family protein n=1 Tax=Rubritalea tangerina TaxID=430798 RepID=A0ABW4ZDB7_9BACT
MPEPIATVLQTGPATSYQDSGRYGWLQYGLAQCGALDTHASAAANTLLHNLPSDPVIEILLGGFRIKMLQPSWIAHVGGCHCPQLPSWTARYVSAGEILDFQPSKAGVCSYLAAPGGWQARTLFGSSAYHSRSDIGQAIVTGAPLAPTLNPPAPTSAKNRSTPPQDQREYSRPPSLRLYSGPHSHLFSKAQHNHLLNNIWKISARSDRSGYRLTNDAPECLQHHISIHSTPTILGSIQIPPSGEAIVTLNDGPTVGGYPIIALVHPEDLSWLVQQHAHSPITFTHLDHKAETTNPAQATL